MYDELKRTRKFGAKTYTVSAVVLLPVEGEAGRVITTTRDGSTELPARTKNQSRQMEPITIFDPDGWKNFPFTTQVEVLLGGVGRAVYPDDTEQFLDQGMNGEVELTYSPRLAPDELEEFFRKNIAHYEEFNAAHAHELDECKRVPMVQFWPDDQAT